MTKRSKNIRNATIAALVSAVLGILIQQNLDPDSPLARLERQSISEVRSRTRRAKAGSDEAQAKAMMSLIRLLEQRGYSTKLLSPYLHRLLRRKLTGMDSAMAEALLEELSALAAQKGE